MCGLGAMEPWRGGRSRVFATELVAEEVDGQPDGQHPNGNDEERVGPAYAEGKLLLERSARHCGSKRDDVGSHDDGAVLDEGDVPPRSARRQRAPASTARRVLHTVVHWCPAFRRGASTAAPLTATRYGHKMALTWDGRRGCSSPLAVIDNRAHVDRA
jgi:hypothetical protein